MKSRRAVGDAAEDLACNFLRGHGYLIIERNVSSRFGEIDVIAVKEEVLHFIEVKSAPSFEQAVNNITSAKLNKITKTAYTYMKKKRLDPTFCIDAIIVVDGECELLENILI